MFLRLLNREKMAYAHWGDSVDRVRILLLKQKGRRNARFVAHSEESFFNVKLGWQIENWVNPLIPFRIRQIVSSGILDYWKGIERHLLITNTTRTKLDLSYQANAVKELNLDDNVIVVFILYLTLLPPVLTSFILELTWYSWRVKRFSLSARFFICIKQTQKFLIGFPCFLSSKYHFMFAWLRILASFLVKMTRKNL